MSSLERAAGTDVDRLIPRDDDPQPEPGKVLVYVRPVDDVLRMCARFSDGTVVMFL